ncbi:hypothetical protein [Halocella sp. SP3-1]|uniref:hypothetical protein n=1 Tax=Halocella sp. SP3-1 TaxID=2382161 RepID=UPI000F75625C|nr:hypothetical protein [Halocella sp. SP3-1]AZO93562.1 hypothetical protein D7D81_02530 [Halocella sp. SP3-1]
MKQIDSGFLERLESDNYKIKLKQQVDWDKDGAFNENEDISDYIKSVTISKKLEGDLGVNVVDTATVILDNSNEDFSPKNLSGKFAGNVVPNSFSEIRAGIADNTLAENEILLFDGYVQEIKPSFNKYEATLKMKDYISILQNEECPEKFYYNYLREEIIKEWLDIVGINYTDNTIDRTTTTISDSFEDKNMWEAIQDLAKSIWADVYIENGTFYFKTRISPDYEGEQAAVYTFSTDNEAYDENIFEITEEYKSTSLYNQVKLTSQPLIKQARQAIWTGAEEETEVQEEYSGSDIVWSNDKQRYELQLTYVPEGETTEQATKNTPIIPGSISVYDINTDTNYVLNDGLASSDYDNGVIAFEAAHGELGIADPDTLRVKYQFYFNKLAPHGIREFIIHLDDPAVNIEPLNLLAKFSDDNQQIDYSFIEKEFMLTGKSEKQFYLQAGVVINWRISAIVGSEERTVQKNGYINISTTGNYTIKTSLVPAGDNFFWRFFKKLLVEIIDPDGNTILSEQTSHTFIQTLKKALFIKYLDDIGQNISDPDDVSLGLEQKIYEDQKNVKVTITNKTNRTIELYGYLKNREDTKNTPILVGEPLQRSNVIEITEADQPSIEAYGKYEMSNIELDYISSETELKKLAQYLLYQYSTPKSVLTIKTKPLPFLELMDKVHVHQKNRDIDNDFFIKEIKHIFKNGKWEMELKLEQAQASNWEYTADGNPALNGINNGEPSDFITLSKVTGVNALLLKASTKGSRVEISWNKSSQYDLSHYNIYRKPAEESTYTIIDSVDYRTNSYIDTTVEYGSEYSYKVSIVDNNGNESELSNEDSVEIIAGSPGVIEWDRITWFADKVELVWQPHPDDSFDQYEITVENG